MAKKLTRKQAAKVAALSKKMPKTLARRIVSKRRK